MEFEFVGTFVAFLVILFLVISCIMCCCCCCCRNKKTDGAILSSPAVVTTATQQVPFTPDQRIQNAITQSSHTHYSNGLKEHPISMPMPNQHSYSMPRQEYQPHPGVVLYPKLAPWENTPPSYNEILQRMSTSTHETNARQAPYNPNFTE